MEAAVQTFIDALRDGTLYQNPYPIWDGLREVAPLVYLPVGEGMWLTTRWSSTSELARDPRLSSARGERVLKLLPPENRHHLQPVTDFMSRTILWMDPPRHTRIRKLMGRAFSPERIESMRPRMEALFDQMLDEWIASGEGDIMASLVHPFPALVIADMLGFPQEDWRQFMQWADALIRILVVVGMDVDTARHNASMVEEMLAYIRAAVAERCRNRTNDVLSLLLEMEDGDVLDREEVVNQAALLLFAGHETTRNLIGGSLHLLLSVDGLEGEIPSDPLSLRLAVDELLRLTSPIQVIGRLVTEDFEYQGAHLRKGEYVLLGWAAANRDPLQFPEPNRILLQRRYNPHLAFGAGPHACLGLHLARIEAQIVFDRIWRKLPDLRLVPGGTEWNPNMFVHGPRKLEVAANVAVAVTC
ncbi:MAG TPA: cytochrome P450 [Bryobacteraceae bacterium]|nr:cytochrome P450 [Bryobacteraceae bacterium]